MPFTLSTPTNQVTYNTVEDQYNYELNITPSATIPSVQQSSSIYITRLIERLFAGVSSTNWVCYGLDVNADPLTLNSNSLSFSISPGLMMIDTSLVRIDSTDIIVSDPISLPASGSTNSTQYMIAIFANYSFSTSVATTVTYSSYVMDRNKVLKSPSIFAGTEKILLAVFDVVSNGTVWTSSIRMNSRYIREIELFTPTFLTPSAPLENSVTLGGTTYLVRGSANILASAEAYKLAKARENLFILDSFLYKPFEPYLYWELTDMFQQAI